MPWLSGAMSLFQDQATLREHVGPIIGRGITKLGAHFLGFPEALDRGRVDPVKPQIQRIPDRGDGIIVILRAPPERPAAAIDGPGAESNPGDLEV
jgi:hypothetical protein